MAKLKELGFYDKLTFVITGFYFVCLLFLAQHHKVGGYDVETDFYGSYAPQAERLFHGKIYEDPYHGPGYSIALALTSLVSDDFFLTGKLLSIASSIFFGILIFNTLKNLFNSKLAFYTFLATFLILLPYPVVASTDMFFAFVVGLCLYILYRKTKLDYMGTIWAGLVAGYAFLTRYDAVFLVAGFGFSILMINPQNFSWLKRIKLVLLFSGSFILIISPWLIINYIQYGELLYTFTHLNMAVNFLGIGEGGIGDKLEIARALKFNSLVDVFLYDPMRFIIGVVKNTRYQIDYILLEVLRFPLYLFVVPGIILLIRRATRAQLTCFTYLFFGFLIFCLAIVHVRYYLPFVPFLSLFCVYFFLYFEEQFENSPKVLLQGLKMKFSTIAILFLLVYVGISSVKKTINYFKEDPVELISIADFLKENSQENDVLMARKPHLGYLSQIKSVIFPKVKNMSELLKFAKENSATLLLYSNIEAELRPEFKFLLEPEKVPQNLRKIYQNDNPRIILYRILNYSQ